MEEHKQTSRKQTVPKLSFTIRPINNLIMQPIFECIDISTLFLPNHVPMSHVPATPCHHTEPKLGCNAGPLPCAPPPPPACAAPSKRVLKVKPTSRPANTMSLLPTTLQFLLLISSSTAQAQPLSAAPFLRWAVAAQDRVTAAPVVGSDPSIYVGSWDCSLYCIQTSPPQQGQVL